MEDLIKFEYPKQKDRNLYFIEQVDQKSIGAITKDILEINEYDEYAEKYYAIHDLTYIRKPIKIYIDSYGGNVYQCFGLISIMETSKTPIHTIVTGCAMSCGFMMLIHGHKRFAYELSTVLYHQVSSGVWGPIKDIEAEFIEGRRLQDKLEEMTLRKTKITQKKLEKIYNQKYDWHIPADEALKLGIVDEIIK